MAGGLAFFTIPTCFLSLMIPLETLNEHAIQSIKFSPYILKTIICILFIFNCHQLPTLEIHLENHLVSNIDYSD